MPDRMQYYKIEVHPQHPELKVFVESVPFRFKLGEGEVIYKGRNELRRMSYSGKNYVVKSFCRPHLINRLVYGHLRPSKAERAYRNGIDLLSVGVANPLPIGYVEVRSGLLLDESYLITAFSECPYTWNDLFYQQFPYVEQVVREVGKLTATLHEHGFAHLDYGRGNILFRQEDGVVKLELVDLNRIYRGRIGMIRGCKNLERLPATPEMHWWISEEYARARGFNEMECFRLMQAFRSTQPGKIDNKY